MVVGNKKRLLDIFEAKTTQGAHPNTPPLSPAQSKGANSFSHGANGGLQRAANVWKCYRNPNQPRMAQDIIDEINSKQGGNIQGTVIDISLGNPGATSGKITTRPW